MKSFRISPLFKASLISLFSLTLALSLRAADPAANKAKNQRIRALKNGVSTEVLISVKGTTSKGKKNRTAAQYAAAHKLKLSRTLQADNQMAVLQFPSVSAARKAIAAMKKDTNIGSASFNRYLPHVLHSFVSDDPYFSQQWHLNDSTDVLPGVGVAGAWEQDFTGSGVVLGIVDEGVEKDHEDLAPNFDAADSYDFAGKDFDPSPEGTEPEIESHGTSVAGVAAGAGGNGIGITGAAPRASVAGLKVTFDSQSTVADFVNATKYHSSSTNTNIKIKNHSYGFSYPFITDPEEESAFNASAAAGTIHTVSAGNERKYDARLDDSAEDSNKSVIANNPNVITVAALGSSGKFSVYSSLGSNVFVTASSSSFRTGELDIITTDRSGANGYNRNDDESAEVDADGYAYQNDPFPDLNYTSTFGGTSSSAPLVAGVLALVKQANPKLNVRLAKHLLADNSVRIDPTNPTWVRNKAGYYFSTDYGFGLVDATALVNKANSLKLTPLQIRVSPNITVNKLVPDLKSLSQKIAVQQTGKIEEIQIRLVVTAAYEGDLEATITSPSGTVSKFCHASADDSYSDTIDWWFTSNAFWGEQGIGNWTVTVSDTHSGNALTWKSVQLKVRSDTAKGSVAPFNDNFVSAIVLVGKKFSANANLELATAEPAELDQRRNITANHSVWYTWTAPVAGRLNLDTLGSTTDTILSIYNGTSLDDLSRVVTNDNTSGSKTASSIFTNVSQGTKYYISVDAARGEAKSIRLNGQLKGCGE